MAMRAPRGVRAVEAIVGVTISRLRVEVGKLWQLPCLWMLKTTMNVLTCIYYTPLLKLGDSFSTDSPSKLPNFCFEKYM